MTVQVGDKIPSATVMVATADGPEKKDAVDVLGNGKTVLFAVPGAFTPTCSARHLPGFVEKAQEIKGKGVDTIVCMSVNDAFVMQAWGEQHNASGDIVMLADGNGELSRAFGLTMDGTGFGMGERSQRFSALIENGEVKALNVEAPGAFEVSSADHILTQI
ncbi:MAG: peroxiredoxin [Pseudomonadota bacterium]